MSTTSEIRAKFLEFFKRDDHQVVASSPLVPENDPTLMFTNSGMVQFKNVFTGQEQRPYSRATTSQKCVRAGGKHNDLENVGYTARHHTFFEMLGNFSFGDYFKDHAIEQSWNLITKEYGLPADKLLVTVYADDDEAAGLWTKIAGLPKDRIIRISTDDNFWRMGDLGPCGPCSEIFYDHGPHIWGGPPGSPEEDGDRFIEIWNLVFMQFEQQSLETRVDLPKPSIDTGMGLERIAAVLQGQHDNYDIDLIRALIEASAGVTNTDPDGPNAKSHRVIADHLRSSAFLIADGVMPSNEGRGYVLRRIMRRAMRHLHMLGSKDPTMYQLVPALVEQMGAHFQELKTARSLISQTLELEETNFKKTLDRGLRILTEATSKLADKEPLDGAVAFKLYDTYGFPLDLTEDILRSEGRAVDQSGFDTAMQDQKARARAAWTGSGEAATQQVWFDILDRIGQTDFLGYSRLSNDAQIVALIKDGKPVGVIEPGDSGIALFNQTSCYAESGGQEGDFGHLISENGGAIAKIVNTTKELGGLYLHHLENITQPIKVGDNMRLSVDAERRQKLQANHSATHLLHEALRLHLGPHVAQRGSLVAEDRLRFDFSHNTAISQQTLFDIEHEINAKIIENSAVTIELMNLEDAKAAGATALFGEKYAETVRVVSMGGDAPFDANKQYYSMELCGGTHVSQTGEIGQIRLVGEQSLASGVRRIEAITGLKALQVSQNERQILDNAQSMLRTTSADFEIRIQALLSERKAADAKLKDLQNQLATGGFEQNQIETINGHRFVSKVLRDVPAKSLKGMADDLLAANDVHVVALIANQDGKASMVIAVRPEYAPQFNAVELVNVGAACLGGKGGGRADMAQAGGNKPENSEEALVAVREAIQAIGGLLPG